MKTLYFILFFFLLQVKVDAITYDVWQEEKIDDLTLTYNEIKMYKWYQENKEGEYLLYDIEIDKYPYNDLSNQIKGNFSNWEEVCIKNDYRNIEYKDIYEYKKLKDIKYIKIENLIYDAPKINIKITNNFENINYKIIDSDKYLNNYLEKSGYLILELNNYYNIENLSINIETKSINFFSTFLYDIFPDNKRFILNYTLTNNTNYNASDFNKNKNIIDNYDIYETINSEFYLKETNFLIKTSQYQLCRYQDILTYHYDIIRTYYDDNYHIFIDNYIKDLKTEKTFYKYYYKEGKNNTDEIINLKENNNKLNIITNTNNYLNKNIKNNIKQKKDRTIYIFILIFLLLLLIFLKIKKKCRMN